MPRGPVRTLLVTPLVALAVLAGTALPASATPIPPTQDPNAGPPFVGSPVSAQPLPNQPEFQPPQVGLHADGGNTKVYETPGPLGVDPSVTSSLNPGLGTPLFDAAGRATTTCISPLQSQPNVLRGCLAAVDPTTFDVLTRWDGPPDQNLNLAYVAMTPDAHLALTSKEGHVYLVERSDSGPTPTFTVVRDIDLRALGAVDAGQPLLASVFDAAGNIWFTTGGIIGIGDDPGTDTVVGYVDPTGAAHWVDLPDQIVENGMAVNDNGVFVVTGPAGPADVADAIGHMYAFRATPAGVEIVWQETYDAGSALKPGGFARGSGATPTLLGGRYVAITDNADSRISVKVYRQKPGAPGHQLVCSVPVFDEGASANDIGMIGTQEGPTNSVVVLNDYNAPPVRPAPGNGPDQSMNEMAPGMTRIQVGVGGKTCTTTWSTAIRVKSVPALSTQTGLIYGYTQDPALAAQGIYVWYVVAVDYRTGEVVWQVRTGAGFTYNDSYRPAALGPDGTLYQGVITGVVMLRDA